MTQTSSARVIKPGSTALYPVPVVLVSCGIEKPNIITLAWVGTLCSDPPTVGISIRPGRYSHTLIGETGEFVVNVPRADQVNAVDYCGQVSGREVDKWAACKFTPVPAQNVRTPLIAECPVALECKVSRRLSLGSHDLFVGEVLAVQIEEGILDDQGHIDYEKVQPLAYVGGFYWQVGACVGRHGDWRNSPPK
jgi:flavin reductase (DIM6/NTAB) family NADH-FMN oxidoreductase RutF